MNYNYLKEKIFDVLNFDYKGEIDFGSTDGFCVSLKDGKAMVSADSEAAVCRALTEFAKAVTEGKTDFEIVKKAEFKWCGPMLDMSRDGVLTVESLKKFLDLMACFGMNMLMIYTEDVYEMKKYPFFGYKRGRYTLEELRAIDDYAYSLGIEVIPCIQTLGHLDKYMPLKEAGPVKDTNFNLKPECEASYEFIEEMLLTMKKAFRSTNIHVGMDEVADLGRGQYFNEHRGEVIDQDKLLYNHLHKVCELCEKHGYMPIMWSDLMFVDHTTPEIFTYNSVVPDEYKENMPRVRLMYWYYSSQNKNRYYQLLKKHKETGAPIAFGGGGWNWEGFAPNFKMAFDCSIPALEACVEENPEMVLNTLWGNGGCEDSYFINFPTNALFAEYHWSGKDADVANAWDFCEFVTKTPQSVYENIDKLNYGLYGNVILGRKLLRRDVFETIRVADGFVTENLPDVFKKGEPMATYRKAAEELESYVAQNGDWNEYCSLSATVLRTAAYKAEIHTNLYDAYQKGDKEELARIANVLLPECRQSYIKLYDLYSQQWQREYKAFGWEVHCQRKGFQLVRIDYAIEMLTKYLNGEIEKIEELEEKPLNQDICEYDTMMFD